MMIVSVMNRFFAWVEKTPMRVGLASASILMAVASLCLFVASSSANGKGKTATGHTVAETDKNFTVQVDGLNAVIHNKK